MSRSDSMLISKIITSSQNHEFRTTWIRFGTLMTKHTLWLMRTDVYFRLHWLIMKYKRLRSSGMDNYSCISSRTGVIAIICAKKTSSLATQLANYRLYICILFPFCMKRSPFLWGDLQLQIVYNDAQAHASYIGKMPLRYAGKISLNDKRPTGANACIHIMHGGSCNWYF